MRFISSLFIISVILFYSCNPVIEKDLSKKVYTYGYYFRDYSVKGFLFSPDNYYGKYESIALLVVEIYPQIFKSGGNGGNNYGTDSYGVPAEWRYLKVSPREVLDSLYNLAKGYGADAVVKLEINSVTELREGFLSPIPGVSASGFAIKRLE